jgi:hypothetical protein
MKLNQEEKQQQQQEQEHPFISDFAAFFILYKTLDFEKTTTWIRSLRRSDAQTVDAFTDMLLRVCTEDNKRRLEGFNSEENNNEINNR